MLADDVLQPGALGQLCCDPSSGWVTQGLVGAALCARSHSDVPHSDVPWSVADVTEIRKSRTWWEAGEESGI